MVITSTITQQNVNLPGGVTQLFDVNIFGETVVTTVTRSHLAVNQWINVINVDRNSVPPRHIGFEIEVDADDGRIGTWQLCYGNRCLVFRFKDTDPCPWSLQRLLGDADNVLVGSDIMLKLDYLTQRFQSIYFREMRELDEYAPQLKQVKHKLLETIGFGQGEGEGGVETDWARPLDLSLRQVHFACLDVFLDIQIVKWLKLT